MRETTCLHMYCKMAPNDRSLTLIYKLRSHTKNQHGGTRLGRMPFTVRLGTFKSQKIRGELYPEELYGLEDILQKFIFKVMYVLSSTRHYCEWVYLLKCPSYLWNSPGLHPRTSYLYFIVNDIFKSIDQDSSIFFYHVK